MVNKNVLAARLERLREYIHNLEAAQQFDCKRFIEDPFIHGMAERNLHLAIECLMDIGNHIITRNGYRKPESYADIFRILQENAIISAGLLKKIEGMRSEIFWYTITCDWIARRCTKQ